MRALIYRLLGSVASIRREETASAGLMFAYSFLAMTSYNILKPITRSQFITALGADNLPYVLFFAGILIGVVMHFYTSAIRRVPRQRVVPLTQLAIVGLLVVFWALLRTGAAWVTVAFYFFGLILGILLISQFWTLANDIFDARQAKRLFGFIGGGASLGGALGAALTAAIVEEVGSEQLVLVSAVALAGCSGIVLLLLRRHRVGEQVEFDASEEGVGGREAVSLLSESRALQVLALTVGCAAAGAAVVEQQLNMAAEALRGGGGGDSIAAFLAEITAYLSIAGFVVQVALVSRIHRSAGIGVALLLLPIGFSFSAAVILLTGALWAVAGARVLGSTMRYTLDKTTREVLFIPLPAALRHRVKPFIDVTMDRFAKAVTAVLLLVLVQPWGLALDWRQLSYASLGITGLWIAVSIRARREYLKSFRASIDARTITPDAVATSAGEAVTVEALVEELANPDETGVLYAIEMLEAMDKPHLVTPLLLRHESAAVRVRVLNALASGRSRVAERWRDAVERMTRDDDVDVRAAALTALATLADREAAAGARGRRQDPEPGPAAPSPADGDAAALMAGHLHDPEPRVAVAAAAVLARSPRETDVSLAVSTFQRLIEDTRDTAADGRKEAARALAGTSDPRFRILLVTLLHDHDADVVVEAIRSARSMGVSDGLFLPALISRLGHRTLKNLARETLVGFGDEIVPALRYVLENPHEYVWVKRHIPSTLGRIPTAASMDALVASLDHVDGFLRFKIVAAIETIRRNDPALVAPAPAVEALLLKESNLYCNVLTLSSNLREHVPGPPVTLLERALGERLERILDRIYRLAGVLHEVGDIAAARHAIERGDRKRRAHAIEYLDNLLRGNVRKSIMPLIDETPMSAKVHHANRLLKTTPRDLEDTLAQLIHDGDRVVAATAIHYAASHGPASLTDDLEWVNAHRSSTDPRVSDTAAWVLSSRAAGGDGAPAAGGRLPTVELVDRLSRTPIFEFVSVDNLFRAIESGRQVQYAARQEVGREGATEAVELLIEGAIHFETTDNGAGELRAPAILGLEEVLQGAPTTRRTWAGEPSVCIRIRATDFMAMVSDDVLLAQGLFRFLLAPGGERHDGFPAHRPPAGVPQDAMQPFDKAMLLRQHPLLARAAPGDLVALLGVAREAAFGEGETVFREDDLASLGLVLDGALRVEADGAEPVTVGPGGTLLVAQMLAGSRAGWRARAMRGGRILRAERDDVFMLLSERIDLLQGLFSGVLATVSSAPPETGNDALSGVDAIDAATV